MILWKRGVLKNQPVGRTNWLYHFKQNLAISSAMILEQADLAILLLKKKMAISRSFKKLAQDWKQNPTGRPSPKSMQQLSTTIGFGRTQTPEREKHECFVTQMESKS